MNLIWRLLGMLLALPFQKKVDPLDEIHTQFRCWPTDLDVNLHMNNGKFFSLMDLGRLDLIFRTGNLGKVLGNGLKPMVLEESIRFRKSIELFQSFTVTTRIVGWKGQDIFIEQKFLSKDQVCAWAFVRGRIVGQLHRSPREGTQKSLDARAVVELFGYTGPDLELPSAFQAWSSLPRN